MKYVLSNIKRYFLKRGEINDFFQEWEADPAVSLVLIKGAGDRAFCAGGDVRGEFELSVPTMWDHINISCYDFLETFQPFTGVNVGGKNTTKSTNIVGIFCK